MRKNHSREGSVEHGRGQIRDNTLRALVTSPLFKTRIVRAKKGKGAYQRFKRGQNHDDSALFYSASYLQVASYDRHLIRRIEPYSLLLCR